MFFRYQFWIAQMTDRVGCVCLRQGETLNPAPFCLLDYFGAQQSASLPLSDLWSVSLSPLRNRFGDYVSVSCSWISARAEKPNLKSISRRSTVGTDGGTVGVTRPAGMPMAASVDIFNCGGNNSEGGGAVYSPLRVTVLPFSVWTRPLNMFLFITLKTPGTYVDLTFFSFLPPPSVFISAPRFATTQTAKTWTAKAPFICVSHVTRAVIQRTRTTCTLTGTLDLTYSLKVDSLFLSVFGILSSDDDVIPTASFTVLMSRTFHFFFSVLS